MRIHTRKDTDTITLKLAEEFEEHYNKCIQFEPGIDRRVVFEKWAGQKASSLQKGVFKMYSLEDE